MLIVLEYLKTGELPATSDIGTMLDIYQIASDCCITDLAEYITERLTITAKAGTATAELYKLVRDPARKTCELYEVLAGITLECFLRKLLSSWFNLYCDECDAVCRVKACKNGTTCGKFIVNSRNMSVELCAKCYGRYQNNSPHLRRNIGENTPPIQLTVCTGKRKFSIMSKSMIDILRSNSEIWDCISALEFTVVMIP